MGRDPVLVTGGRGFLGSHLCARLAAEGERVRILAPPRQRGAASAAYGGALR